MIVEVENPRCLWIRVCQPLFKYGQFFLTPNKALDNFLWFYHTCPDPSAEIFWRRVTNNSKCRPNFSVCNRSASRDEAVPGGIFAKISRMCCVRITAISLTKGSWTMAAKYSLKWSRRSLSDGE